MNKKTIKLTDFVMHSSRKHLRKNDFTELVVPRMVRASGACENVNTLFEVSSEGNSRWFDGKKAYLAQTGQLYLEALVPELGNVYCVGPSFRAEPEVDNRHLVEFQMIEIEHPGGFDVLLKNIEGLISNIAHSVAEYENAEEEFGLSPQRIEELKSCPKTFVKLTYDEAIEELRNLGELISWGDDINSFREKMLVERFQNQPLFITHFPDPMWKFEKETEVEKFFNMIPDPETPGRVLSADLILPYGGEAVGAAARIYEYDVLIERLENSRMFKRLLEIGGNINDFEWYINYVKENKAVPHSGCGFGMARIMQWVLGAKDIREAVAFPLNKKTLI